MTGRHAGRAKKTGRGMVMIGLFAISSPLISSPVQAHPGTSVPVTIHTTPSLKGVDFSLAGRHFSSNQQGTARTTVHPGTYEVSVGTSYKSTDAGLRAKFSTWSGGATSPTRVLIVNGPSNIQAGFEVDYLVKSQFSSADGSRIAAKSINFVTLVDDEGSSSTHPGFEPGLAGPTAVWWDRHPPGTRWLAGNRIAESDGELTVKSASYQVDHAVIDGIRIPVSSAPFAPAESHRWPIRLEAHSVGIEARDLIFASRTGSEVRLTYPDGRVRRRRIENGELSLLPPGTYVASAEATGLPIKARFTVPRSGNVRLPVITYADMAAGVLALGALAMAVLIRRRSRASAEAPVPANQDSAPANQASAPANEVSAPGNGSSGPDSPMNGLEILARVDHTGSAGTPAPDAPAGARDATWSASESIDRPSLPEGGYVRVTLVGGRLVEGWSRPWNGGELLMMDVACVRDAQGREITKTSLDRFLFRSNIVRIELLTTDKPRGS